MKSLLNKRIYFLSFLFIFTISCEKEPSPLDVPFISYTVKGDLLNKSGPFLFSFIDRSPEYLNCYLSLDDNSEFQLILNEPQLGTFPADKNSFNDILIVHNNDVYSSHGFDNNSTITITEYNEYYGRVSGTFYFEGVNQDSSTDTLIITDGVFNNLYFKEISGADVALGKMNFKKNDEEINFYSVYDGSDTGDNLNIYGNYYTSLTYPNSQNLNLLGVPSTLGEYTEADVYELSYRASMNGEILYCENVIPGAQIHVININSTERFAEVEFNFSVTNDIGDTIHITDGYTKVYY